MLPKIATLCTLCRGRDLHPRIEVDGDQDSHSVRSVVEARAGVIVAGTAVFGKGDYAKASRTSGATPHEAANRVRP